MFRKIALITLMVLGLSWSSFASDDPHGPVVVAQASQSNVTSSVSGTLITPVANSLYLITVEVEMVFVQVPAGGNNSSLDCTVFSGSTTGPTTNTVVDVISLNAAASSVQYVVAAGGVPVTYTCAYGAGTLSSPGSFSMTVIKL